MPHARSGNRLMNLLTSWRLAPHLLNSPDRGLPPFVLQTVPHLFIARCDKLSLEFQTPAAIYLLPARLSFIFFIACRRLLAVVIWLLPLMLLVLPVLLLLLLSFICRHQLFARITRATLKFY